MFVVARSHWADNLVPKITCVEARSGTTITDIHNQLDFELEILYNDTNDALWKSHWLSGKLDHNTRDPGSVCKQKKQIAWHTANWNYST